MTDLITRLKELDGKRTPGEWTVAKIHGRRFDIDAREARGISAFVGERFSNFDDAAFITTLANEGLPALEAMKAENKRLREIEAAAREVYSSEVQGFGFDRTAFDRLGRSLARQALGEE